MLSRVAISGSIIAGCYLHGETVAESSKASLKIWMASFRATLNEICDCDNVGVSLFKGSDNTYIIRIVSAKSEIESTAYWQHSNSTGVRKLAATEISFHEIGKQQILRYRGVDFVYENGFSWYKNAIPNLTKPD